MIMRRYRSCISSSLVLFALLLLSPQLGFGYEVKINATNGTENDRGANGLQLTLYLLKAEDGKRSLLKTVKGTSDSQGIATFTLEDGGEESLLGASTEYRGVTYSSKLTPLIEGQKDYDLSIKVYELSDDEGLVYIKDRRVFIQKIKDGVLSISDGLTIVNSGNRTYVGRFNDTSQLTETVRIGLPYGYERPVLDGSLDRNQVKTMGNGLVLQEMIPPGENMIFISYKIRTDIGRFELNYPVDTPYKSFKFLIPEDFGWKVQVKQLDRTENLAMGNAIYKQWEGKEIKIAVEAGKSLDSDTRQSMGFVIGPKIILEDPEKAVKFGKNEIAISAAVLISIVLGLLYIKKNSAMAVNDNNSSSGLKSKKGLFAERPRLLSLIKRLDNELNGDQETKERYKPYRNILMDRVNSIDRLLKKNERGSRRG